MVLFYYMFEYTKQNMEVMREAVALAFFLLAILALDERKTWKVMLYVITAFLFHKFSLVVFGLFFGFYLVYSLKRYTSYPLLLFYYNAYCPKRLDLYNYRKYSFIRYYFY